MQAVEFQSYGTPSDVVEPVLLGKPSSPSAGQVLIKVEACPINPSDLLRLEGAYGDSAQNPERSGAGSQGVGSVAEVGAGVTNLKVGDLVPLHTYFANNAIWREYLLHDAQKLSSIPHGDMLQLAMTIGNPPSAWLILNNYVDLHPGEWVIQNAANSTVGYYINQFAKYQKVNVVNVVRTQAALERLNNDGINHVLIESELTVDKILRLTNGTLPKLAIDAVAGNSASKLMDCLADKGTVVNYGMLSGKPICFEPKHTVFRDLTIKGFWLQRWWDETDTHDITSVNQNVAQRIADGTLSIPIDSTFTFEDVANALRRIERGEAKGKVFLVPPDSRYLGA